MIKEKMIELKKIIINQSATVEKMISKAIKGLIERNEEILKEVIERDEFEVNNNELIIDEKCVSILALYHPEAKDLRTIMMISKMSIDLERIGDSAVNIAQSSLYLIDKPPVKPYIDLPKMAEEAMKMLSDSINSFVNESDLLAVDVCKRDAIVDGYRDQIIRELITHMFSDPGTIERGLQLISISNNLERIADLSTNIAEESVYVAKGKVIKHRR
ncbi:MAG TPA: phosphate signaling complex protein PhoU, partial [Spirochaetota bacterium]|nr:phosphate signaling complex protein PhoU [Spirochaetota bacterium]